MPKQNSAQLYFIKQVPEVGKTGFSLSLSLHAGKTCFLPLYTPAKHILSLSLSRRRQNTSSPSLSTRRQNTSSPSLSLYMLAKHVLSFSTRRQNMPSLSLYTPAKHVLSLSSACPADIFTTEVAIDVTTHHQQIFKKLIKILTMTGNA